MYQSENSVSFECPVDAVYPQIYQNESKPSSGLNNNKSNVLLSSCNADVNTVLKAKILNLTNLISSIQKARMPIGTNMPASSYLRQCESNLKESLLKIDQLQKQEIVKISDIFTILNSKIDVLLDLQKYVNTVVSWGNIFSDISESVAICISDNNIIKLDDSNMVHDPSRSIVPVSINTAIAVAVGSIIYNCTSKTGLQLSTIAMLSIPACIINFMVFHMRCNSKIDDEHKKRDEIKSRINKDPLEIYNYMDILVNYDDIVRDIITSNPELIKYVENYRLVVKMLKYKPESFRYIANPASELCLKLVKDVPEIIQYIVNPTDEMCLIAVESDHSLIKYIPNPSDAVYLIVIAQDPFYIKNIPNPSNIICSAAIRKNKYTIKYIEKQTLELCILAAKQSSPSNYYGGSSLQSIMDPAIVESSEYLQRLLK